MNQKEFIKFIQSSLNAKGEKLTVDGDFGPKTESALSKYDPVLNFTLKKQITNPFVTPSLDNFGAPWIFANIDLLGRDETDPVLNARYVPEWKLEGLPGFKTLAGSNYAWCSLRANADFRKVGVKGTNKAGAYTWSTWGKKCPFWFGAILPIKHSAGGRHVGNFLYWIDEKKMIAATLDGNRGNKFCVSKTDLSGSGDVLVGGPRWSNDVADGQEVAMADVLAKYPYLKVGSVVSGSTR